MLRRIQRVVQLNLRSLIVVILQVSIVVCLIMYAVKRVERRADNAIEDIINDNVFASRPNGSSISLQCSATSLDETLFLFNSVDLSFLHSRPLLFPFPKILRMESHLDNSSQEHFQYISMAKVFSLKYTAISFRKSATIIEILKNFCNSPIPSNYRSLESAGNNKTTQVAIYIVDNINFHLEDKIPESTLHQLKHEVLFSENINEFYELSLDRVNCTSNDRVPASFNIQYKCISANIFSTTAKGINNAISTLSQLVSQHQPIELDILSNKSSSSSSQILKIFDWPENHWRGLLLDLSRHFQPVKLLKRCIDAMQSSKLNTLHLHLTDSQSFPVLLDDVNISTSSHGEELLELSSLAKKGSFSSDKMYTKRELIELVAYGRAKGVDIVAEIDMPAHTLSWGNAFKDVYINCSRTARSAQTPWNIYPLDPSNEKTYKIIYHILAQVVDVFPSRYLHIGGDEVSEQCWQEDEELMSWAKRKGFATRDITKYFEERVFSMVYSLGKVPIVWQGILDSNSMPSADAYKANQTYPRKDAGVDDDSSTSDTNEQPIVEPWKCWGGLALRAATKAVEGGHPVIMSACWYLDYNQDWSAFLATDISTTATIAVAAHTNGSRSSSHTASSSIRRGRRHGAMTNLYDSSKHRNYFVGGEAAMWTEMVDHTNLECRMWPRAAAVAARLWGLGQEFNSAKYSENNRVANDSQPVPFYLLNLPQTIQLNVEQTKLLYAAFVAFRFYIFNSLGVSAAPLVFHFQDRRGSMRSMEVTHEADALRFVHENITSGVTLSSTGSHSEPIPPTAFRITSQCLGIPEAIQRPLSSRLMSVAQLNIADGSTGARGEQMLRWLQQKASDGVALVGFCELNGWEKLQSDRDLMKNRPLLVYRAANAGFVYSHVMVNSQPYNIGLVSALPFEVVQEAGPRQGFQRGFLHVFLSKLQTNVIVVHLHAHQSQLRALESARICTHVKALLDAGKDVVIMGDFNTLSPYDMRQHDEEELVDLFNRKDDKVFDRLKQKYLDSSYDKVDYRPMEILLSAGLHDACVVFCKGSEYTAFKSSPEYLKKYVWSLKEKDPSSYSSCMRRHCAYTEPTKYNPEWNVRGTNHPYVRLDFILVSSSIVERILQKKAMDRPFTSAVPESDSVSMIIAGVDASNATGYMSDHYPVFAKWLPRFGDAVDLF